MRRGLFLAAFLLAGPAPAAVAAENAGGPHFAATTLRIVEGRVQAVERAQAEPGPAVVAVRVQATDGVHVLLLAPETVLEELGFEVRVGDELRARVFADDLAPADAGPPSAAAGSAGAGPDDAGEGAAAAAGAGLAGAGTGGAGAGAEGAGANAGGGAGSAAGREAGGASRPAPLAVHKVMNLSQGTIVRLRTMTRIPLWTSDGRWQGGSGFGGSRGPGAGGGRRGPGGGPGRGGGGPR